VGSNPLRAMCIFLILARRQLYGGMGMGFTVRGMRMHNIGPVWHSCCLLKKQLI
jgi:hypothetical protein